MGILYTHARMLLNAKNDNASFENVLTIGRQSLYLLPSQFLKLSNDYNIPPAAKRLEKELFADDFLKTFCGAKNVTSLDYSDYQECSIVHDMNFPVDTVHHQKYDVVIDGGSLEHVFNFPVALANCMQMVKKGGSLFIFSMANNHFGHGFYQFSPELFYRVFQKENGYSVKTLLLEEHPFPGGELTKNNTVYSVADPAAIGQRVGLVCKKPIMMAVHAVRTETTPIFGHYPIQSDYLSAYADATAGIQTPAQTFRRRVRSILKTIHSGLPVSFQEFVQDFRNRNIGTASRRHYSLANRLFFRKTKV